MRLLPSVLLAGTFVAGAQQPADIVPAEGAAKFTSSTQLVVEAVTVTDRSGRPIEGLSAPDFTLTEDGVPQAIRFCEFQRLQDAPVAASAARSEPPQAARLREGQANPEIPVGSASRDKRLLVLYFDLSAMPAADKLRALAAAEKFIRSQLTESDNLAVMKFAGGMVRVVQGFTGDRDPLLEAINSLWAVEGQDSNDETAADLGTAFGQDDGEFNLFSTDRQLSALQTAVQMLAPLKEKKALVYFASSLRLNGVDNQAQLRATLNAAVRANVAFFPIDARGLVAQVPLGDATRASPGGLGMYTGATAGALAADFQRSQDTLYALAADTGGKALMDSNDLSAGIVQAQKAFSSYYLIGYYPSNTTLDGKFRRISIALKEVSAKLEYRRGYYAGKQFRQFTTADKERQLEEALMLEDPITELTIAMEVNYFQLNRAEYYVPVVLKIPGSELVLARRGGFERTVVDFIGEIKSETGGTVQNIRDKVELKISDETAAQLARRPIQYDAGYTLLPGTYVIKVLARDNETGRIGTYLNKFTVPNLNKEMQRIPISSVVLSSQRIDLRDALYTAGKDKEQITNPLVQDGQKLIPSVTRVFSKSREMFVYLQAYDQTADGPQPLVGYVTFYRGQRKAYETQPVAVTERLSNRLKTTPLKFSIGLGKLPPGRYDFQVTVLDPKSQKAAFWQAPVMVVP